MGLFDRLHPRDVLFADHARLDALLLRMSRGAGDGASRELWTEVGTGLREHIDAEDRFLLPAFARDRPIEAGRLRVDHETIRGLLDEIGFGAERGVVREHLVRALMKLLRTHAAREEASVYRWANQGLSAPMWKRLSGCLSPARTGILR